MAPRAGQDDRILRSGGVEVGPERPPLLPYLVLGPAVAGDPFPRPEFVGLGRHQVLEFLDGGDPAEPDVPPGAAADVDVRVVEAGHGGPSGKVHFALRRIPVAEVVAAHRQHLPVPHGERGPRRSRLVEREDGPGVQQQVHRLRSGAGRRQDDRPAQEADQQHRGAAGPRPALHRWISTSAASPSAR